MSKEKGIWYEDTLVYFLKGSHSAGISLACKAWLPKWRVYKWKILLFSQMSPGCKCLPTVNPAVYPALIPSFFFFFPVKHKPIQKRSPQKRRFCYFPLVLMYQISNCFPQGLRGQDNSALLQQRAFWNLCISPQILLLFQQTVFITISTAI